MFNPSQNSFPSSVVSLRNLTVSCSLSFRLSPSRSSRTSFLFVSLTISFSRIARCRCSRADNMDYYTRILPFCQHLFLSFSLPIIFISFPHVSEKLFREKSDFLDFIDTTLFRNLLGTKRSPEHRIFLLHLL